MIDQKEISKAKSVLIANYLKSKNFDRFEK
jgi:hypothetical protein